MSRITFPVTLTALHLCASCASPEAFGYIAGTEDSEDAAQWMGESTPVADGSQNLVLDPVLGPSMAQEARGAATLRMQKTTLLVSEYVEQELSGIIKLQNIIINRTPRSYTLRNIVEQNSSGTTRPEFVEQELSGQAVRPPEYYRIALPGMSRPPPEYY